MTKHCTYPDCNCPFDMDADNKCIVDLPQKNELYELDKLKKSIHIEVRKVHGLSIHAIPDVILFIAYYFELVGNKLVSKNDKYKCITDMVNVESNPHWFKK